MEELSAIINIILCILSFVLAVVSVITVIITLRQNNKMIENSTRPYITIYGQKVNFGYTKYFLIIKNFGSSSAVITKFSSEIDLSEYTLVNSSNPFEHIVGTNLAPQQSIICDLEIKKLKISQIKSFPFEIEYKGVKKYSEKIVVNFIAETENVIVRRHSNDSESNPSKQALDEFRIVSDAIQGIGERML